MRRLILAAVLALAACATPAVTDSQPIRPALDGAPHPAQPGGPTPAIDAKACAAKGGTVRPVCMLARPMCVIPYADAGKACRDDDDCQGSCHYTADGQPPAGAPVTGTCQVSNNPCGCFATVEDGKLEAVLCVD